VCYCSCWSSTLYSAVSSFSCKHEWWEFAFRVISQSLQ
jgi:hypothetical protein